MQAWHKEVDLAGFVQQEVEALGHALVESGCAEVRVKLVRQGPQLHWDVICVSRQKLCTREQEVLHWWQRQQAWQQRQQRCQQLLTGPPAVAGLPSASSGMSAQSKSCKRDTTQRPLTGAGHDVVGEEADHLQPKRCGGLEHATHVVLKVWECSSTQVGTAGRQCRSPGAAQGSL